MAEVKLPTHTNKGTESDAADESPDVKKPPSVEPEAPPPAAKKAPKGENSPQYWEGLRARALETAQSIQQSYDHLKKSAADTLYEAKKYSAATAANHLASLLPDARLPLKDGTTLALADVADYVRKSEDRSLPHQIHDGLRKLVKEEKQTLAHQAAQLREERIQINREALAAQKDTKSIDPEKLHALADRLAATEKKEAEVRGRLTKLGVRPDGKTPKSNEQALRELAKDVKDFQDKAAALDAKDHPLQKKINDVREEIKQFQQKVDGNGCVCRPEMSVEQRSYYGSSQTPLCVLRSAKTGSPRVWMNQYRSDNCASDCERWRKEPDYTEACATKSEQDEFRAGVARSTLNLDQAELALEQARLELQGKFESTLEKNREVFEEN